MSTLAVVGTFYRRSWAVPRVAEALRAQTRKPDELWLMYEDPEDAPVLVKADWDAEDIAVQVRPQPSQNPLGVAINQAIDLSHADYIAYLTDDSLPLPDKYRQMAQALDENPEWGAVYCSQDFGKADSPDDWLAGGHQETVRRAAGPQAEPFAHVDHTQVMHRRVSARWPMSYDDRRLSDAHFFRDLVAEVGPLMPVPEVLDWTRQLPDGLSQR